MIDLVVADRRVLELDFQRQDEAPVGAPFPAALVDRPGVFGLQLVEQPVAQKRPAKPEIGEPFLDLRLRVGKAERAELGADRGAAIELAKTDQAGAPVDAFGFLRNRASTGQASAAARRFARGDGRRRHREEDRRIERIASNCSRQTLRGGRWTPGGRTARVTPSWTHECRRMLAIMNPTAAWLVVLVSGCLEMVFAVSMKLSESYTRLVPSLISIVAAIFSVWLMSLTLKVIPVAPPTRSGPASAPPARRWWASCSSRSRRTLCVSVASAWWLPASSASNFWVRHSQTRLA